MKKSEKNEAGIRSPLARDSVLRAAVGLLDESGIDSLSMRALGKRLGVEAMSLYNHVSNKEDLLDGALDLVLEEIAIPAYDGSWKTAMRERAVSARLAFKRHPWASGLLDSRVSSSPARLRYYDAILGVLRQAGFTLPLAARAYSLIDSYVYGFCRQSLNMSASGEDSQDGDSQELRAQDFQAQLPPDSFPHLAEMAALASKEGYDEEGDFEFGLDLILQGLESLL
ncbi:MAG: TetR family transcriptional regulator [Spirochaetes bacterium]|nr:MAG: TetR family transcriptional regulator [Spirochaetota bacterium]